LTRHEGGEGVVMVVVVVAQEALLVVGLNQA